MITTIIPRLPFISKQATVTFYQKLGFTVESDYSDYIIMRLGNAELHFFAFPGLQPEKSDFKIYVRINEIEKFYAGLQQQGVVIHPQGRLQPQPWGQKEFAVLDPNGTLLTFGEAV